MMPRKGGGGTTRPRPNFQGAPFRGDPMNGVGRQMPGMGGGGGPQPQMGGQGGGFGQSPGWEQRGFESQDAARSVGKQYGLVQQEGGGFGKPDMDFLNSQMSGWINNQQGQTPVGIGGARWNVGQGVADFTGQASDAPFGNMPMGQAFNSGQQAAYNPFGGGQTRPRRTRTFGQVM